MLLRLIERLIVEGRCFTYDATEHNGVLKFGYLHAWLDNDGEMFVSQFTSGGIMLSVDETIDYMYEVEDSYEGSGDNYDN